MYRRESGEFDRTGWSILWVSSAFIIDVQSELESDTNDMTTAYTRILIHTMNNSLFPNADSSSTTWTGPPPEIVTVWSLLYASLATSLFVTFLAILGKQRVDWYLRNRGGSVTDRSRDRQRKLDELEKWHFHLAIESLPGMLQLALPSLSCALSGFLGDQPHVRWGYRRRHALRGHLLSSSHLQQRFTTTVPTRPLHPCSFERSPNP